MIKENLKLFKYLSEVYSLSDNIQFYNKAFSKRFSSA